MPGSDREGGRDLATPPLTYLPTYLDAPTEERRVDLQCLQARGEVGHGQQREERGLDRHGQGPPVLAGPLRGQAQVREGREALGVVGEEEEEGVRCRRRWGWRRWRRLAVLARVDRLEGMESGEGQVAGRDEREGHGEQGQGRRVLPGPLEPLEVRGEQGQEPGQGVQSGDAVRRRRAVEAEGVEAELLDAARGDEEAPRVLGGAAQRAEEGAGGGQEARDVEEDGGRQQESGACVLPALLLCPRCHDGLAGWQAL